MDFFEYYLDLFGILMFMVLLVVFTHTVAAIVLSYADTGSPLLYLKNFYHTVYHINI